MSIPEDRWRQLSQSPTVPHDQVPRQGVTGADLFAAPEATAPELDEKLRRTYFWIVNRAVISPYYDVEFAADAGLRYPLGDAGAELVLPAESSFSSNVLLPLRSGSSTLEEYEGWVGSASSAPASPSGNAVRRPAANSTS